MSELEKENTFDILALAALCRSQKKPFTDGAYARLKGIPFRTADRRWENGWHWANRILAGLELLYGSQGSTELDLTGAESAGEPEREQPTDDEQAGSYRTSRKVG